MELLPKPSLVARAARIFAFAGLAAAVLGPMLAKFGWLAPLSAFTLFALALPFAVVAILLGLFGLWATRKGRKPGARAAWFGLICGLVLFLVIAVLARSGGEVPPIHDITTNVVDPPPFVVLAEAPDNVGVDLTYPHGDPNTPTLQQEAYPDLATIHSSRTPAEALDRAAQVAEELGWTVVARSAPVSTAEGDSSSVVEADSVGATTEPEAPAADVDAGEDETLPEDADSDASYFGTQAEPVVGYVEATDTSSTFRFVDDIVIRIAGPDGADAEHSMIDLRSRSRVGRSDLGANAARIRAFVERFEGSDG